MASSVSSAAVPFYYNDIYDVMLPKTNSFPMRKYRYVRKGLQRELSPSLATFHESPLATLEDLCTVHGKHLRRARQQRDAHLSLGRQR